MGSYVMSPIQYGFVLGVVAGGVPMIVVAMYVFRKAQKAVALSEFRLELAKSGVESRIRLFKETLLIMKGKTDKIVQERDLLREAVNRYGDKSRMALCAKPELQQVVDDAIAFCTPVVGQSVFNKKDET